MRNTLFFSLLLSVNCFGATYHVATSGNNGNPGSEAQPFATIQYASTVMAAGDTAIIHAGTYRETVTPTTSGTPESPITYQADSGATVVVSGCDVVATWALDHDAVYSATMNWTMGRGSNLVFINGLFLPEAQWPAVTTPFRMLSDFYTITGGDNSATWIGNMSDSVHLNQPDGFWTGATLLCNFTPRYHCVTALVTNYVSGQLQFEWDSRANTSPSYPITTSGIYALYGCSNALFAGSWWYDTDQTKLRLWLADSSNPSSKTVEAKRRDYGFNFVGCSNIVLSGIDLKACTIRADHAADNITIDGSEILYPTHYTVINYGLQGNGEMGMTNSGVLFAGSNLKLQNSVLSWSAGNGVTMIGTNCLVTNCVISYCNYTFTECANVGFGRPGTRSLSNVVTHCTLTNASRALVSFTRAVAAKILNCYMAGAQYDGGVGRDLGVMYGNYSDWGGTEIAYNRFVHSPGVYGIYCDYGSTNINIHHNIGNPNNPELWTVIINSPCDGVNVWNNIGDFFDLAYGEGSGAVNCKLQNNIGDTIYADSPGVTKDHNLSIGGLSVAARNALFVDYPSGDYRPVASASSLVNVGVDVGLTKDFNGRLIPNGAAPDIGPFEYYPTRHVRVRTIRGK